MENLDNDIRIAPTSRRRRLYGVRDGASVLAVTTACAATALGFAATAGTGAWTGAEALAKAVLSDQQNLFLSLPLAFSSAVTAAGATLEIGSALVQRANDRAARKFNYAPRAVRSFTRAATQGLTDAGRFVKTLGAGTLGIVGTITIGSNISANLDQAYPEHPVRGLVAGYFTGFFTSATGAIAIHEISGAIRNTLRGNRIPSPRPSARP